MVMLRILSAWYAPLKNGHPAYSITGVATIMLMMRRYARIVGSIPCMSPTYIATANIITCIIPRPATARRLRMARRSARARPSEASVAAMCGRYPRSAMCLSRREKATLRPSHTTRARPVALFTLACTTPSICCRERPINQLQAAQVTPSIESTAERPSSSTDVKLSSSRGSSYASHSVAVSRGVSEAAVRKR